MQKDVTCHRFVAITIYTVVRSNTDRYFHRNEPGWQVEQRRIQRILRGPTIK